MFGRHQRVDHRLFMSLDIDLDHERFGAGEQRVDEAIDGLLSRPLKSEHYGA